MDNEDLKNVSEDALRNYVARLTKNHQESIYRNEEYATNVGIYTSRGPYFAKHFERQEIIWQRILSNKIMLVLNELIRRQKQTEK